MFVFLKEMDNIYTVSDEEAQKHDFISHPFLFPGKNEILA